MMCLFGSTVITTLLELCWPLWDLCVGVLIVQVYVPVCTCEECMFGVYCY